MKILLSAYSCQPDRGSEPGIGWNWAFEIAKRGHEVWVLTRINNQQNIEKYIATHEGYDTVHFAYHEAAEPWLYLKPYIGIHVYYQIWQKSIVPVAMEMDKRINFDIIHHITFGVFRQNTYLHHLGKPLFLGPLGGGEKMSDCFLKTAPLKSKLFEYVRSFSNKISLYNPQLIHSLDSSETDFFQNKGIAAQRTRKVLEQIICNA